MSEPKQKKELFMSVIIADSVSEEIDHEEVEQVIFKAMEEKYGKDFIGVQYNDHEWGEQV